MNVDVRIKNDKKISRRFSAISRKLQTDATGLSDALLKSGLMVEKAAVQNVSGPRPEKLDRVTGTLAASINTQPKGLNSVSVGLKLEYARIHEFGGPHMPARPYLRPALDDSRGIITQYLTTYIKYMMRGQ